MPNRWQRCEIRDSMPPLSCPFFSARVLARSAHMSRANGTVPISGCKEEYNNNRETNNHTNIAASSSPRDCSARRESECLNCTYINGCRVKGPQNVQCETSRLRGSRRRKPCGQQLSDILMFVFCVFAFATAVAIGVFWDSPFRSMLSSSSTHHVPHFSFPLLQPTMAYIVNDTTLELYLTATVRPIQPYTQSIAPVKDLLPRTNTSLSDIEAFIKKGDDARSMPVNVTALHEMAPCYFDVPTDEEDDFSGNATAFAAANNVAGDDSDRRMYYRSSRVCSFIELVGTHNRQFRNYGKASHTVVNASESVLSERRWRSGASEGESSTFPSLSSSAGNSTMVTAVATLVVRSYSVDNVTGERSLEPISTIREPARGIFLRLVGMSTVAQFEASLRGSEREVGVQSTAPLQADGTATSGASDTRLVLQKITNGIHLLLRRVVRDQEAFDALWSAYDNVADDKQLDESKSRLVRVLQESPAILFDDSEPAVSALSSFASYANFTELIALADALTEASTSLNPSSTAAQSTSPIPSSSPTPSTLAPSTPTPAADIRTRLLQREALAFFSSWMLMNNNNLRGTTSFTDINGVAEFPYFRGLDCVRDNILWLYVRRRVPSLSDEDAVLGLKGVNRTVVKGDMRMTLRPVPHAAFVLAEDDSEEDAMSWEGALMGASEYTEVTRTQTLSLPKTFTKSLDPQAMPNPPQPDGGGGILPITTAPSTTTTRAPTTVPSTAAPTTIPPSTTTLLPPPVDPEDLDGTINGAIFDEYRSVLRGHTFLRTSVTAVGRNVTSDMGEVQKALRFILIDSCGRSINSVGRLRLEGASVASTTAANSAAFQPSPTLTESFSQPRLTSLGLLGGGFIGSVVSAAQQVLVHLPREQFTNLTNSHSPNGAAYTKNQLMRGDFASGVDGRDVQVPNITLHPSIVDRGYMFRFTVNEPLWSVSSSERLLRKTSWYQRRPWSRIRYKALSDRSQAIFNFPMPINVFGIAFDAVALAQNTSGHMQGQVEFRMSAQSDAMRGLAQAHGHSAIARLPRLQGVVTYAPLSNPLCLTLQDVDRNRLSQRSSLGEFMPQPLAGVEATSPALMWSPMFLTPSQLFPKSTLQFNTSAEAVQSLSGLGLDGLSRLPTPFEYLYDAVGVRYSYAMERYKELKAKQRVTALGGNVAGSDGATGVYTAKPLSWALATPPARGGETFTKMLDPTLFTIVSTQVSTTLRIDYTFVAQSPAATRPHVTGQPIPITFFVGYGDEQQTNKASTSFLQPLSSVVGGTVLSRAFPLSSNERRALFNADLSVLPNSDVSRRCDYNPDVSSCALRASAIVERGLVISWVTPLNTLANTIQSAQDIVKHIAVTSSHTIDAAPRAFKWAQSSIEPLDLRYKIHIVPRGEGTKGGRPLFFFSNSDADNLQAQLDTLVGNASASSSEDRSSAFMFGIDFVHQLYLKPLSSYYTHLDEDVSLTLLPSLVRAPYNLEQMNMSFRILATDASSAEKARNVLSLFGMWGRTSSVGTISSVMSVAICSTDAGMPLDLALYPLQIPIGDGPTKYYVGALIMNTALIIVFCIFVTVSGKFTSRFGSDSFPNEAIILTFLLYPGTALAGMSSLSWLNETDTGLRYLLMAVVILHVIGFPIAFFVLGFRRRPQWEQTKRSDEVDGKGDVLGGMSRKQKMALKKRQKRYQKQREAEQLRTKRFDTSKEANNQTEADKILAAMNAKLGTGGRSQALSLLKFFTPEGHYVMVHSDHLRFESTYAIYRGPVVNFVVAEVLYPFMIACCAFLDCPNNAYMAMGLIIAHIIFTFILHPHITLGRNLVNFTVDALLIVATALQIKGDESISRSVYLSASLLSSTCNIIGLAIAFWCHRWWRGTVKNFHKTLRRWSLREEPSKRARFAKRFIPLIALLQEHLDSIHAERPDVIYRNKRRLTLLSQIVHQKVINAQELDEAVELDPRELIKESAEMEAVGMLRRRGSVESIPDEFKDPNDDDDEGEADRANRRRAFSSYKKAVASAKSEDYFDKAGGGGGMELVSRFIAATTGRSKASKNSAADGVLNTPMLAADDIEDTYVSGGPGVGEGSNTSSIHNCLYSPQEMEAFYAKPENAANRDFDPFKLSFGAEAEGAVSANGIRIDDDEDDIVYGNRSRSRSGNGKTLVSLEDRSPPKPRLGPAVIPHIRNFSVTGSFDSSSRLGIGGGVPDKRGGASGVGPDGTSVIDEGPSASVVGAMMRSGGTGSNAGYSARRRAALDRISLGSAGERNAVADLERLRQAIKEEKARFERLNEQRLQQYVYGSRREVMTNPEGTLITPELPTEWAEALDNASFAGGSTSPLSPLSSRSALLMNRRGFGGMEESTRSGGEDGGDGALSNSEASLKRSVTRQSRRSGGNDSDDARRGAGVFNASPNLAEKVINRSHRHRGSPSGRKTFGRDDDEGTVVHVFLTPHGMEESRVSTSAADRTLQLAGSRALEKLVTQEAAKRVRAAFNSNIFSPEEVEARKSAFEYRRRIRKSGRGGVGGRADEDDGDENDLLPQKDIFGRYRKPRN